MQLIQEGLLLLVSGWATIVNHHSMPSATWRIRVKSEYERLEILDADQLAVLHASRIHHGFESWVRNSNQSLYPGATLCHSH
jgi:hypothetical protein